MRVWTAGILLAALAATSGCGCEGSAEQQSQDTATPAETTTPAEERLVSDILFTRIGGFVGLDDRLEIGKDGLVRVGSADSPQTTKALTAEQITRIARLLHDCGLFDRDRAYTSQGADLITYTIRYNGVTIQADENKVPGPLRPPIDWLVGILSER